LRQETNLLRCACLAIARRALSAATTVLQSLRQHAEDLGVPLKSTLLLAPLPEETKLRLSKWLQEGRAGEMNYLAKGEPVMGDLKKWKPWAKSVALFAFSYHRPSDGFRDGGTVARYALGKDYHNVIGRKLEKLGKRLRSEGIIQRFRAVTDAAPVMEREWAIRGQMGWRGKNTLLLDPDHGPWVLLAELLLDVEVDDWSAPTSRTATCGTCTACLDACPTDAFTAPYELDPRRCISYLTIESKKEIPEEFHKAIGDRLFGCDVCLDVCPFGKDSPDMSSEWGSLEAWQDYSLPDLLAMEDEAFQKAFQGNPLRRAGLAGIQRNAKIVLENRRKSFGSQDPSSD
jgi:epoxyqueuosine reductase